jgi:23S rRNA (uracil1939-C5)-methyltransferase
MVVTDALQSLREALEPVLAAEIMSVRAVQLWDGIHVLFEAQGKASHQLSLPECTDEFPIQYWWHDGAHIRPLSRPVRHIHDLLPTGNKDIQIRIGPEDFVQGQYEGNQMLIRQVLEWGRGAQSVVDLFCGVGNLSLPLAHALNVEVHGAEVGAQSVKAASDNAKSLGVQARYQQLNLFEPCNLEPFAGADVLILDPPRKGARMVCSQMGSLLPGKIIMISCDVAAGARDATMLQSHGYRLRELKAMDMFPYAGHVEALSLWMH